MNRREEEMLIKAAMSARLPWLSPDAEPEYVYTIDPPELIDKCCHCSKSVCVNCIGGEKQDRAGQPKKADLLVFAKLVKDGLSVRQVCENLGIARGTFYNYKNQLIMKGALA